MLFQFCHQGHVFSPCDKTLFWIKESLSGLRIVCCLHRTSKTGLCHVEKRPHKAYGADVFFFFLCIKTASRAARNEQISASLPKRCNSTIIHGSSKSSWNGNCNRFLYWDLYLSKKASQTRQTVGQDLILSTRN